MVIDQLIDKVHHADIFDLCAQLPDQSVDMILCDLPYGVTACEWDVRIPMEPMWAAFKRIIKPRGAIVLTATNPFAAELIMSNRDWFKYEWVSNRRRTTGFLDVARKPMRKHELILVFGGVYPQYYPQMDNDKKTMPSWNIQKRNSGTYGDFNPEGVTKISGYPHTILNIPWDLVPTHPTQKPVALFEYLIRTYTQPGEVVFDPCVGSGTTALAARNCGRQFIVGDMLDEYVQVARERLAKPYTLPMFDKPPEPPEITQMDMFAVGHSNGRG